jgi:hypothetical protein
VAEDVALAQKRPEHLVQVKIRSAQAQRFHVILPFDGPDHGKRNFERIDAN